MPRIIAMAINIVEIMVEGLDPDGA